MWHMRINHVAPSTVMPILFNIRIARPDTNEICDPMTIWYLGLLRHPQGRPKRILTLENQAKFKNRSPKNNANDTNKNHKSASSHLAKSWSCRVHAREYCLTTLFSRTGTVLGWEKSRFAEDVGQRNGFAGGAFRLRLPMEFAKFAGSGIAFHLPIPIVIFEGMQQ